MLVEAGARTVIVGHSGRRGDQNETSQDAWGKAAAAHRHGLNVILCCGETEAERDAGRAERVVQAQIEKSVPDDATARWFTLAYEPRSEARRVGKECVRTCRSRWSPYH